MFCEKDAYLFNRESKGNSLFNREMVIPQICLLILAEQAGLARGLQWAKEQTFITDGVRTNFNKSFLSISGEGVAPLEDSSTFSVEP